MNKHTVKAWCVKRPNGVLVFDTCSTTQADAWWEMILLVKADWKDEPRRVDYINGHGTSTAGPALRKAARARGWDVVRVEVTYRQLKT